MSVLKYLANGAMSYDRGLYPANEIKPEVASHQYNGAVAKIGENNLIDNAITVKCPADCDEKVAFWKEKRVQCLKFGAGTGVATAVGVYAATALIAGASAPYIATAIGVAGVALVALSLYRSGQAGNQAEAWENPVTKVAELRKSIGAHSDKFMHAYNEKAKNTALHPVEVQQLWLNWVKSYYHGNFSNAGEIKGFFSNNPLDDKIFSYADAGNGALDPYRALQGEYLKIKSAYSDVREVATLRRDAITHREEKHVRTNRTYWDLALAPLQAIRDSSIKRAEEQYERAIQLPKANLERAIRDLEHPKHGGPKDVAMGGMPAGKREPVRTDRAPVRTGVQDVAMGGQTAPAKQEQREPVRADMSKEKARLEQEFKNNRVVINAKRDLEAAKSKNNLMYALASAPIDIYFQGQENGIKKQAAQQRGEVTARENGQIAEFAPVVQDLCQAFNNQTAYEFKPVAFDSQQMPDPAPPQVIPPPPYNPAVMNQVSQAEYEAFIAQLKK